MSSLLTFIELEQKKGNLVDEVFLGGLDEAVRHSELEGERLTINQSLANLNVIGKGKFSLEVYKQFLKRNNLP